jgi:hypothetical protein
VHLAQFRIREMIPSIISSYPTYCFKGRGEARKEEGKKQEKRERNRRERASTYVLESPYKSAGALTNCFPLLHRLHLNVSCVSHSVSLNSNNCLRSSWVK